ncbi:MAG: sulfatase, partial [Armatimonadetes bacterium]|nr:sulfatase [Armatimonadota bacterium]
MTDTGSGNRKPNILLLGIDSLSARNMSCYGYGRLTTPHLDRFAQGGTLFENHFSPHIPTTSGYANMLTGRDCFGTQVVALRHRGPMRPEARTLAEILRENGYTTTSVGFEGNPASRGFDTYLHFPGWGPDKDGRSPKAESLNSVTIPEMERLCAQDQPWLLFLRHM